MSNTAENKEISHELEEFTGRGSAILIRRLMRIGDARRPVISFNWSAFLLGPLWFAARGLRTAFIGLLLVETLALFIMGYGMFGDLGLSFTRDAERLAVTIEMRKGNLDDAVASGSSSVDALRRNIEELQASLDDNLMRAEAANQDRMRYLGIGGAILLVSHLIAAFLADHSLFRAFSHWRSAKQTSYRFEMPRLLVGIGALALACLAGYLQLSGTWDLLALIEGAFSRSGIAGYIDVLFKTIALSGEPFFDAIRWFISTILSSFEQILINMPVVVVFGFIVLIAWNRGGSRVAILTAALLSYIVVFGFWEKAMMTVALLGTASLICISVGVPLGILCGRSEKVYRVVRPVLDFMQTMPSFVYLIPVIAFFGTGKTPAIVATMVFGMPPVVRLTTLGIRNVPESVREAAIAFGASRRYLLFKVDLPLAVPSIMAGINQTILLCLSMVVIASLIGAKGLGEDVLVALQYATAGNGLLAGLAILCCAIVLDRIVEGKSRTAGRR